MQPFRINSDYNVCACVNVCARMKESAGDPHSPLEKKSLPICFSPWQKRILMSLRKKICDSTLIAMCFTIDILPAASHSLVHKAT